MIVRRSDLGAVIARLTQPGFYSVDTETTGLRPYLGDRLFSIIVADVEQTYYFNFQKYPQLDNEWVLPLGNIWMLKPIFEQVESTWCMHNAKFDLAMLWREGLEVHGVVHCTEMGARLERNTHLSYGLAECAERVGLRKDTAVDDYIAAHKLYTVEQAPGKKAKKKRPHFEKVPFEIITAYGQTDARITRALGVHQVEVLKTAERMGDDQNAMLVLENERRLTKTCLRMERYGIKINRAYCLEAFNHEQEIALSATRDFKSHSGFDFVDSGKALARAFDKAGEAYPRTAKGNPSFTDDVLEGFTSPLAKIVQRYRSASKKANTYYRNFLDMADCDDRVHANIRQAGTATGRFSYSDPNLQNLNKDEDQSQRYIVRRSFVPTDPDWCLVAIDYEQMEYRMMLDYAKQTDVIQQVLDGVDVHQATANIMGVSRQHAKTINFMLLYGGGAGKLASSLGVDLQTAKDMRRDYFAKLPRVAAWKNTIENAVARRTNPKAGSAGYIINWLGRRCEFADGFSYTAPNHLIQGGCADVVKVAMNRVDDLIAGEQERVRMLVQVHDELLFEVRKDFLEIIPKLKEIMEKAFPSRRLPLVCSVDHSWISWGDKVKGMPNG